MESARSPDVERSVFTRLEPGRSHGRGRIVAAAVSMLLGCAVAMITCGLIRELRDSLPGDATMPIAGMVGALLALALGIRVPQQFAMWLCSLAWNRFVVRGRTSALSGVLISTDVADRGLYWVTMSVIALVSGVFTAILPLTARAAAASSGWVHAHFVWSEASLLLLQTVTVFLAGLIPLASLGLSISCVHHMSCRFGQWESRASAWLLLGAACGIPLSSNLALLTGRAGLALASSSIPILLVALLCAGSESAKSNMPEGEGGSGDPALPIWTDRWPTLLRAGIVLVGSCAVFALGVWSGHIEASAARSEAAIPAMFAAMGAGALAGSRDKQRGLRSIGGFGVACGAAGVIIATSAFGLAGATMSSLPGAVIPAGAGIAALGYAMAYGHQTLLHRVASRSAVGATILSRLLVIGAMVSWLATPAFGHPKTAPVSLAAMAVLLMTLGGSLILYEPSYSPRTRRARLCAVCASIAAVITIAAHPAGPWRALHGRAETHVSHSGDPPLRLPEPLDTRSATADGR